MDLRNNKVFEFEFRLNEIFSSKTRIAFEPQRLAKCAVGNRPKLAFGSVTGNLVLGVFEGKYNK